MRLTVIACVNVVACLFRMRRYHEHAGITIYHGDCRDVIEDFGLHFGQTMFDLLLTDPPYGINADRDRKTPEHGWVDYGATGWDDAPADPQALAACMSIC